MPPQHLCLLGRLVLCSSRWVALLRCWQRAASGRASGSARPEEVPAPPPPACSWDWHLFQIRFVLSSIHASSWRVPFMQCLNCLSLFLYAAKMVRTLMSCLQSLWPWSTGVQRVFSGIIQSLKSHSFTMVMLIILHEGCKYQEMCVSLPCSCT